MPSLQRTDPPIEKLPSTPRLPLGAMPVLVICSLLILTDNLINIGRPVEELTKFYLFWLITPLELAMMLSFAWAAWSFRSVKKYIWSVPVRWVLGAIVFATGIGVVRQVSEGGAWILYDLRILLMLFVGVILGSIMVKTRRFLRVVAWAGLVGIGLLVYATVSMEGFQDALDEGLGRARLVDPNIYYYWEFLLIPCGILGVRRRGTRRFERVVFFLSLGVLALTGVVVTATRSCLFTLVLMLILLGLVSLKRARFKRLGWVTAIVFVSLLGGVVYYAAWVLKPKGREFDLRPSEMSLAVVERMQDLAHGDENLGYRAAEVRQLWREMEFSDFLVGGGLGATISTEHSPTPTEMERTPQLHISIFNVLLKFGAIGFLAVAWLAAFVWPGSFIRALLNREKDHPSTAALAVYPAIGAATGLMCMSGGYTPQMYLWLGIAFAYYLSTKTNGSRAIDGGADAGVGDGSSESARAPIDDRSSEIGDRGRRTESGSRKAKSSKRSGRSKDETGQGDAGSERESKREPAEGGSSGSKGEPESAQARRDAVRRRRFKRRWDGRGEEGDFGKLKDGEW